MHRSIHLSLVALSLVSVALAPLKVDAQGADKAPASPEWKTSPVPSKRAIETPLKTMINPMYALPKVAEKTLPIAPERVTGVDAKGATKVEPGAIRWHKTFADAKAASAKSGRLVLSFAMIGSLDDKFC